MTGPADPDDLRDRLDRAAPAPPDLAALGTGAETAGRRRRTRRRGAVMAAAALAVAAAVVVPVVVGGDDAPDRTADADPSPSVTSSASPSGTATTTAARDVLVPPPACVPVAKANRSTLDGEAVWARFCPGREGFTAPAEVPVDALVSHLDALDDLVVEPGFSQARDCYAFSSRTYRLQVGYADGTVAQISGPTDPTCLGRLDGTDSRVTGPDGLGVFGGVMRAFGQQVTDTLVPESRPPTELRCPGGPRDPSTVEVVNPSVGVPAWSLGDRTRMTMPATAVRGIVCRWPYRGEDGDPTVTELTPADAERVRIGLHGIAGGVARCGGSPDPTYTAVVEDAFGTRRAVTVIDSECGTVVGGSQGYGLGFPWLDR